MHIYLFDGSWNRDRFGKAPYSLHSQIIVIRASEHYCQTIVSMREGTKKDNVLFLYNLSSLYYCYDG